jgi:hypothetical protein
MSHKGLLCMRRHSRGFIFPATSLIMARFPLHYMWLRAIMTRTRTRTQIPIDTCNPCHGRHHTMASWTMDNFKYFPKRFRNKLTCPFPPSPWSSFSIVFKENRSLGNGERSLVSETILGLTQSNNSPITVEESVLRVDGQSFG